MKDSSGTTDYKKGSDWMAELTIDDVVCDKEFSDVQRPHSEQESEDFIESVVSVGRFTSPLLVIDDGGTYTLIDGYHRYRWWQECGR